MLWANHRTGESKAPNKHCRDSPHAKNPRLGSFVVKALSAPLGPVLPLLSYIIFEEILAFATCGEGAYPYVHVPLYIARAYDHVP